MPSIELKVDIASLTRLSEVVSRFEPDQISGLATDTVNEVADRTYELARNRMNAGISMTDAYMRDRMRVEKAPLETSPRAKIIADGEVTGLSHYNPVQDTQPVKNPDRSKGDPVRGLAPGQKSAGFTVEVNIGDRKRVKPKRNNVVMLPKNGSVIRDTEGNPVLFKRVAGAKTRNGKDKFERLLGPAVYQLFKKQTGLIVEEVQDDLEQTLVRRADDLLKGDV